MKSLRQRIIARAATAYGITLALGGCMNGLENGPQLATHSSTLRPSGFTLNPSERVNVQAQNWCSGTTTSVFSTTSSANKTVFPGLGGGGADAAGFAWSASGTAQGASCRLWTPYGCENPDWGPNQGALRLKPVFTRADGTTYDGAVFTDPASGESHLLDCAAKKSAADSSLTPAAAALACADPDGFADIKVRNVSSTWAFDFDALRVLQTQENDGVDEPYNPAIIGFRTKLTPSATISKGWIGSLSERSLRNDQKYTLDDRNGRVQFRNVQSVSFGDWLGCDPVTSRVNDLEVAQLLSMIKRAGGVLANMSAADLTRAMKIINGFRCDLTQPSKDITVLGVALQAVESDGTPTSWTVSKINEKINEDVALKQPFVRDVGNQLVTLRNQIAGVINRCNSTLNPDGTKSLACIGELVGLKDLSLALPPLPVAAETRLSGLAAVIDALAQVLDPDDTVGVPVVRMFIAITPDFYKLLSQLTGKAKPMGIDLLATVFDGRASITPTFINQSGMAYWLTGELRNFTEDLKQPERLAADRAANGAACPWRAPPETVNTGVNL